MLTIFTNPPLVKATTLKIIEIITRITVIIHAQPFPLNKPHASRKHAIPIGTWEYRILERGIMYPPSFSLRSFSADRPGNSPVVT
jgi:hypothetical protein